MNTSTSTSNESGIFVRPEDKKTVAIIMSFYILLGMYMMMLQHLLGKEASYGELSMYSVFVFGYGLIFFFSLFVKKREGIIALSILCTFMATVFFWGSFHINYPELRDYSEFKILHRLFLIGMFLISLIRGIYYKKKI